MKIDFKQLDYYHHKLKDVLKWMEDHFGVEFIITSQWRVGSGSTHNTIPLRANDLRCLSPILGATIEDTVNANWQYDPKRPDMKVCIWHNVGQGNHLHIQVHDRTAKLA